MKNVSKQVADEKFELEYYECDCGFHLALDGSYLDQVGDIKLNCPACNALIDTGLIPRHWETI